MAWSFSSGSVRVNVSIDVEMREGRCLQRAHGLGLRISKDAAITGATELWNDHSSHRCHSVPQ
jgi:hypothetical protein